MCRRLFPLIVPSFPLSLSLSFSHPSLFSLPRSIPLSLSFSLHASRFSQPRLPPRRVIWLVEPRMHLGADGDDTPPTRKTDIQLRTRTDQPHYRRTRRPHHSPLLRSCSTVTAAPQSRHRSDDLVPIRGPRRPPPSCPFVEDRRCRLCPLPRNVDERIPATRRTVPPDLSTTLPRSSSHPPRALSFAVATRILANSLARPLCTLSFVARCPLKLSLFFYCCSPPPPGFLNQSPKLSLCHDRF